MKLTPREKDKLLVSLAAMAARLTSSLSFSRGVSFMSYLMFARRAAHAGRGLNQ